MTNSSRIGLAVSWSAIDVLVRYGLNFLVLIVLARILSPADFGLVAMLSLFVAVAGLLVDSGFGQALIQRRQTTPADESTIFYFTLLMGALMAIMLCAIAPWIAKFYGQPLLEQMACWMALNLFLGSFGTIHSTLLTKELNFKTIAAAGGVAAAVSGCVAVLMATNGWGVWSLVGQALASTVSMVAMLWLLHSWRPRWTFSFASLQSYFGYGGFLLWTGLLNALHTNLYALLIGKLHSTQEVGYYSQAHRLQQLPVSIMTTVVGRVAFPVFSKDAENKARLARSVHKGLTSAMFVNAPLMLGLIVLADSLVRVLFGDQWLPLVPVLQVLAVSGLLWPLHALNINVLKAQGHSELNARIQLIKLTISISLLLVTSPYGILAIAYGQVAASMLAFFINAHYTKAFLNYSGFAQLRDVSPYLAASVLMGLSIWLVRRLHEISGAFELLAAAIVGGIIYLIICKLAKLDVLDGMIAMMGKRGTGRDRRSE